MLLDQLNFLLNNHLLK